MSRLLKDLHCIHICRVSLEDSVGQEHQPVSDSQLQLLDEIFGIGRDTKWEARGANATVSARHSRIRIGKGWPAFTIRAMPEA